MKLSKLFFGALVAAGLLSAVSCEEQKPIEPAQISVDPAAVTVEIAGAEQEIVLKSNVNWKVDTIKSDEGAVIDWVEVVPSEGVASTDPQKVTVKVKDNSAAPGYERTAFVRFLTDQDVYAVLKVEQKGKPKANPKFEKWNAIEPVALFKDDFSSITEEKVAYESDNWLFYSTDEEVDNAFKTGIFNADKYIQIAPYKSKLETVVAYAIMPKANVAAAKAKVFRFRKALYYKEMDESKLEVVVSKDFAGNVDAANWEVAFDATSPKDAEKNAWGDVTVDLSKYASEASLCIALRYTGKGNTYRIDDVVFGEGEAFIEPGKGTLTVKALVEKLKTMPNEAKLQGLAADFEGIVVANNVDNNFYQMLAIADGTAEPNTGIVVKHSKLNSGFKIGDKVKVSLLNTVLKSGTGMRIIEFDGAYDNNVTVVSSGNEFVVPELTVSQIKSDNYQGMYVTVKDMQYAEKEVKALNNNLKFRVGSDTLVVRSTSYAKWSKEYVNPEAKAPVFGVAQIHNSSFQLNLIKTDDIKAFFGKAPKPTCPQISGTKAPADTTYNTYGHTFDKANGTGKCYLSTMVIAEKEYPGVKLGSGGGFGSYKIVPGKDGEVVVSLFAMAWNGKSNRLHIKLSNGGTVQGKTEVDLVLEGNSGFQGNTNKYTVTPGAKDYFTFTVKGAKKATEILFTTEGMPENVAGFYGVKIK